MKPALRALAFAAALAGGLALAPGAAACPSCASTSAPKERSVWPVVGAFMLVPWFVAVGTIWLVRRESRTT